MPEELSKFEGWAVVEMMGHRREAGYVTTEHFGTACMFRISRPEMQSEVKILERQAYVRNGDGGEYVGAGTKIRVWRNASEILVGAASVYAINPGPEEEIVRSLPFESEIVERVVNLIEEQSGEDPEDDAGDAEVTA